MTVSDTFRKKIRVAFFLTMLSLFAVPNVFSDTEVTKIFLEIFGANNIYETESVKAFSSNGNEYVFLSPSLGANAVMLMYTDPVTWAIYLKKDYINFTDSSTFYYPNSQNVSVTAKEDYSLHYLGIGARKYFFDSFTLNAFQCYIAADIGVYIGMNNYSNISYFSSSGSNTGTVNLAPSGSFAGINFNAGFNYWFSNNFGFMGEVSYRACGGTLKDGSQNVIVPVDYPGFSVKLGISLNFDGFG